MLESINGNEVAMKSISSTDLRLKGQIALKNTTKNNEIVFKMKSTNPRLFEADPIKALVAPGKTISINLTTTQPISSEAAKQISQKNKFMIEYTILQKKVSNIDQALEYLRSPGVQNIKIFINTNSVRNSKVGKNLKEPSVSNSNRLSYHSMAVKSEEFARENLNLPAGDQLDKINTEIEFLEKKRVDLIKTAGQQIKKVKGGSLKLIIFFALGMIAGNLGSKALGVSEMLQQKITKEEKPQPEDDSFFSIFNFGDEEEKVKKKEEKAWWQIL